MNPSIRPATPSDIPVVADILREAAHWLEDRGTPMWKGDELLPTNIQADVASGLFFLTEISSEPAGVMKFQLEDPLFWPEMPFGEAAYLHRLAVRRRFAGGPVSNALMHWAVDRTRSLGRRHLRLDCEASRPRLRAVYERFGFRHDSNKQVGPYLVARYEYAVS